MGKPRIDGEPPGADEYGFDDPDDSWMRNIRAAEAPLPPASIGRFEQIEEVRRGGQGVVYRALDPDSGRFVAIKRLRAGSFATPSMRRRFEREMEVASALDHPNIVTVFGMDVVDGVPMLAMEWIQGLEITRWAPANGRHREDGRGKGGDDAVEILIKVCDAVTYAHQQGVIHRDLKPSNILVDATGEPYVLDFGLAKLIPSEDGAGGSTALTQQFVGTLAYASPEQVRGSAAEVDVRSDVYALGVILYELVTGRLPYEVGENPAEAADTIERCEPLRPSTCVNVDHDLEAIILKTLAKSKAERYQSADALSVDLRAYVAGEPVSARMPGLLVRLRHTARRNRLACFFAATVFLLVVVFAVVAASLAATSVRAERASELRAGQARAVTDFVAAMLASADPMQANDPDITVREVLRAASARIETELVDQTAVEAAIRHVIGVTYHSLGVYDEAGVHLRRGLELARSLHRGDHPEVAAALNELGHLMTSKGLYPEAERLLEEALQMTRRVRGDVHEDVARALNDRAKVMFKKGEYAASEPPWREALAIRRQLLGNRHPLTTSSVHNLAACLHAQGEYAAAEPLYREVLAIDREVLGDDHTDIGALLHNLASLLRDTGRYDEAEAMFLESLEIERNALGPDHPNVGYKLAGLGRLKYLTGEHERAVHLYREAISVYEKSMDRKHPRIAIALRGLGRAQAARGDTRAAEAALREALAIQQELLGEDHPDTIKTHEDLAELPNS